MEQHRQRIESDHNQGIPANEWETLEQIIDGFLRQGCSVRDCAEAYEIPHRELNQWLNKRKSPYKSIKARIALLHGYSVNYTTVVKRIERGESFDQAVSRPAQTPEIRARKAALRRWNTQ